MNIYMDVDNTRKLADEMLVALDDFSNNINKLNFVIDNISNDWRGDDATKFINAMRDKNIVELKKLHDILQKYVLFLKNVPTTYQLLDEVFTSKGIEF